MQVAITPERRTVFLRVLAETGSFRAASRAASPHCSGASPGWSTFRAAYARDLEFQSECNSALEIAKMAVVDEIYRRGQVGWDEPVFQRGARVYEKDPETGEERPASVRRYSDNLLLARAKSLMPEFRDKLEVSGQVQHSHAYAGGVVGLALTPDDIRLLSPTERDQLRNILISVKKGRGLQLGWREPEPRDVTPEPELVEHRANGASGARAKRAELSEADRAALKEIL